MSWRILEDPRTHGHTWEINEEIQQCRIDGKILPCDEGLAIMLTEIFGEEVPPELAVEMYLQFINRVRPGSGKASEPLLTWQRHPSATL